LVVAFRRRRKYLILSANAKEELPEGAAGGGIKVWWEFLQAVRGHGSVQAVRTSWGRGWGRANQ